LLRRHKVSLLDLGAMTVNDTQVNVAVGELLDRPESKLSARRGAGGDLQPSAFGAALAQHTSWRHELVAAVQGQKGGSATLDRQIAEWAGTESLARAIPPYTTSLADVVALVRRRFDKCSYTLSFGGATVWAELGLQPIPNSFRVSNSGPGRPLD